MGQIGVACYCWDPTVQRYTVVAAFSYSSHQRTPLFFSNYFFRIHCPSDEMAPADKGYFWLDAEVSLKGRHQCID